jgi:hypothetical protein
LIFEGGIFIFAIYEKSLSADQSMRFTKLKILFFTFLTSIALGIGKYSPSFLSCSQRALIQHNAIVNNPNNWYLGTELASFVGNMLYEGTDDPFPTMGAGGELGKILRNFSKPFKTKLADLLYLGKDQLKIKKNIVIFVKGNADDAEKHFESLIKEIPKNQIEKEIVNTDEGYLRVIRVIDQTDVIYRKGENAKKAIPTIQIVNKTNPSEKARMLEIKFTEDGLLYK